MTNERTLDAVKTALTQRLRAVRGAIAAERADAAALAPTGNHEVIDPGEASNNRELLEVRGAAEEIPVREALYLEAALHRLAQGSYGICVDCQTRIPAERLAAEPASARCLSCQLAFESALSHS